MHLKRKLVGAVAATSFGVAALATGAGAAQTSNSKNCNSSLRIQTYSQNGTWQYHQVNSSGYWSGGFSLLVTFGHSSGSYFLQNDAGSIPHWVACVNP